MEQPRHILFYDGVCGLCNRTVRFVVRRDTDGVFRFAPLQSAFARERLRPHGRDPADLDTLCLLRDAGTPRETVLVRSHAVLSVLGELGWPWRVFMALRPLPAVVLDPAYRLVAAIRYRVFGHYGTCPLPAPEHRRRFLGLE